MQKWNVRKSSIGLALTFGLLMTTSWSFAGDTNSLLTQPTLVEQYLTKELGIEDLSEYSLIRKFETSARSILSARQQPVTSESLFAVVNELAEKTFAKSSTETLADIFRAHGRTEYNNSIVLGQAGVGKSFLIDQLVAMYGLGVTPEYLRPMLGNESAFLSLRNAYLGGSDVYIINMDLLSMDNTKKGQPWSTADVRMRQTLGGLFLAAEKEFNRRDADGNRVGRRSIFVIDEVATLPDVVQLTLKKILDKTGFKNPNDPILASKDCGYSVVAMTTPDEYRYMVKGDPAIERRFLKTFFAEISEAEALAILKAKSIEWSSTYGIEIDEEAVKLIIRLRKLLNSPPRAMPGSVLGAVNDLFLWSLKNPNSKTITVQDAKQFITESQHLTEMWFVGPNGEPPFHNLAAKIKERVVGQEEIIDQIAARLQTYARMGFGRDVPVFFLGGPSGSGKDTLIKTINQLLFGHDGKHLMFSLGGIEGFGINSIIEGPPLGNHSDQSSGLLVQALENGPAHGIITFNEGKDTPSMELEKLKVFIESGEIRPKGRDARSRPLYFPIFILGQWGENLFQNSEGRVLPDDQIAQIYAQLNQSEIEDEFLRGRNDGRTGAVSRALLDRAKNTGGVLLIAPVARKLLPRIAEIKGIRIIDDLKKASNIDLQIDPSIYQLIAEHAEKAGEGPRAIEATTIDFTEGALNEAMNQGLPLRRQQVTLTVERNSSGETIRVSTPQQSWSIDVLKIRRIKMANDCMKKLG